MSIWSNPSKVFEDILTWWEGTAIGQEIDSGAAAAKTELEALAPQVLQSAVQATGAALLTGISGGSPVADLISAGIKAAEDSFKASETTVAATTLTALVSTIHSSVVTQTANTSIGSGATGDQ